MKRITLTRSLRRGAVVLGLAAALALPAAAPAFAHGGGNGGGHGGGYNGWYNGDQFRGRGHQRPYFRSRHQPRYYNYRPYPVYVPPPAYYYPAPVYPLPSFNLVFPLNFGGHR